VALRTPTGSLVMYLKTRAMTGSKIARQGRDDSIPGACVPHAGLDPPLGSSTIVCSLTQESESRWRIG
jgi:hypothetical protein